MRAPAKTYRSVARSFGSGVCHRHDKPFDLSPAAEIDDIAAIATGIGPGIGGGTRTRTMVGKQPDGVERGRAIGNEGQRRRRRLIGVHNLR